MGTQIPGHLRLEDEEFEEKKPPEALVLPIVLGVPGLASTNVNRDIVGTGIFVRLFVSTNGQHAKYSRHTNMYILIHKQGKTEPRIRSTELKLRAQNQRPEAQNQGLEAQNL